MDKYQLNHFVAGAFRMWKAHILEKGAIPVLLLGRWPSADMKGKAFLHVAGNVQPAEVKLLLLDALAALDKMEAPQ